jgi:hypothetical protein
MRGTALFVRQRWTMTALFALFLVIHGLIHLLGFLKAFHFAELPQLTTPISPQIGLIWLTAAFLFIAAAGGLFQWPRAWWAMAAAALGFSMAAIIPSWTDAKFGALANALVVLSGIFLATSRGQ